MARSQRQTLLSESLNNFMFQNTNVQKEEKEVTAEVNKANTSKTETLEAKKEEKMTEEVKKQPVEEESISNVTKEENVEKTTNSQAVEEKVENEPQVEEQVIEKSEEVVEQTIKMPSGLLPGSKIVQEEKEVVDERVEKNKERIKGDFLAHEVEDVAKLARGRKGAKLERKFISLTKSNQEYLDKQSRYYGMNATTFINYIIEEYKMKNPPLYQNLITIEHNLREEN